MLPPSSRLYQGLLCFALPAEVRSLDSLSLPRTPSTARCQPERHRTLTRVDAGFIKHTPLADGGLRGHACLCVSARRQVPARPEYTTPLIRWALASRFSGIRRPALLDWASFRPHLAMTPLPFSWPSAPRKPGTRTFTSLALCHARHTRLDHPQRQCRCRMHLIASRQTSVIRFQRCYTLPFHIECCLRYVSVDIGQGIVCVQDV